MYLQKCPNCVNNLSVIYNICPFCFYKLNNDDEKKSSKGILSIFKPISVAPEFENNFCFPKSRSRTLAIENANFQSPRKRKAYLKNEERNFQFNSEKNMNGKLPLATISIIFIMVFIFFSFWSNIQTDLTAKDKEDIENLQLEIRSCHKQFFRNKCDTERVPAIEKFCIEKEMCMNRDPKISATKGSNLSRILSDFINNFFGYMGWKALFCLFM